MRKNKIVCKCGHLEKVHPPNKNFVGAYIVCDGCFVQNRIKGIKQLGTVNCESYIPDNLLHIELLAKEKGLV